MDRHDKDRQIADNKKSAAGPDFLALDAPNYMHIEACIYVCWRVFRFAHCADQHLAQFGIQSIAIGDAPLTCRALLLRLHNVLMIGPFISVTPAKGALLAGLYKLHTPVTPGIGTSQWGEHASAACRCTSNHARYQRSYCMGRHTKCITSGLLHA